MNLFSFFILLCSKEIEVISFQSKDTYSFKYMLLEQDRQEERCSVSLRFLYFDS